MLDGGFVIKKLTQRLNGFPSSDDVVKECETIGNNKILTNFKLLRAYFYHAKPISKKMTNPMNYYKMNLGTTNTFIQNKRFQDELELKPFFALRLGETVEHGWKIGDKATIDILKTKRQLTPHDLIPDIEQKGVDLRIGLDIARLSLHHLVDIIVVVTGDSDLVPAFKFARREGIQIFLHHMGHPVRRELKVHADLIL